jgi:hypothetical protein
MNTPVLYTHMNPNPNPDYAAWQTNNIAEIHDQMDQVETSRARNYFDTARDQAQGIYPGPVVICIGFSQKRSCGAEV